MTGWIAVDLDGTLAEYDEVWRGVEHVGAPIAPMVEKVRALLAEGADVRIFTARVTMNSTRSAGEALRARETIEKWCLEHIGRELPVTNVKDFGMIRLYDDRCVQVVPNLGIEVGPCPCPSCGEPAMCCATQGDRKWLHCFACKANFTPEQATFQAGFARGLAEGKPGAEWTCGCGRVNGANLAVCAQCDQLPGARA